MSVQEHVYQPLEISNKNIRLLRVHQVSVGNTSRLVLNLWEADIDDVKHQYDAVSYVWGDDEPSQEVWIDGNRLLVRQNIWRFLVHLSIHMMLQECPLWIDCISINQASTFEKNAQVQVMSTIFRNARRVLIWLGDDSEVSELSVIGQSFSREDNAIDWDCMSKALDLRLSENFDYLRSLTSIFDNIYFTRLWMVQEVTLALQPRIICGKSLLDASSILSMISLRQTVIDQIHKDSGSDQGASARKRTYFNQAQLMMFKGSSPVRPSLVDFLPLTWFHKCRDSRDKIYAILGISKVEIAVNYNNTVESLFWEALDPMNAYPLRRGSNIYTRKVQPGSYVEILARALEVSIEVVLPPKLSHTSNITWKLPTHLRIRKLGPDTYGSRRVVCDFSCSIDVCLFCLIPVDKAHGLAVVEVAKTRYLQAETPSLRLDTLKRCCETLNVPAHNLLFDLWRRTENDVCAQLSDLQSKTINNWCTSQNTFDSEIIDNFEMSGYTLIFLQSLYILLNFYSGLDSWNGELTRPEALWWT